jgi:hypothetical protein
MFRWRRRSADRDRRPITAVQSSGQVSGPVRPEIAVRTQAMQAQAQGLLFGETAGMAGAASVLDAAAAGPVQDHGLRAEGVCCPRCGHMLAADAQARRLVTGQLVHDVCPGDAAH